MLNKSQEKYKRRKRLQQKRKHKPKSSFRREDGKLIPAFEKCICCGKKIRNHHIMCARCHKNNKKKKEESLTAK